MFYPHILFFFGGGALVYSPTSVILLYSSACSFLTAVFPVSAFVFPKYTIRASFTCSYHKKAFSNVRSFTCALYLMHKTEDLKF